MKLLLYFVDMLSAIAFTLSDTAMKSWVSFLLFLPIIAILIPFFIYFEYRKKKGDPIDYSY